VKKIILFPLNIVIYPGSSYSLHIFEERYKKMVNLCLDEKQGFGIIAKFGDEISKVGTYVEITEVSRKYPDGKFDIIIKGTRRFIVVNSSMHTDGYLVGNTHPYYDTIFETDKNIIEATLNKFINILQKINLKLDPAFWQNLSGTPIKSFKIAEKTGLTLEQQQELLILQDETLRLNFLIGHLEKLEKYLSESKVVREIVDGDGYLN
jgi:Lon protease-like protein